MVCQGEFTRLITEVSNKAFNSFDEERRLEHPVSPAYSAIAPPSSPRHLEPSIMTDGRHLEGSSAENQAHHGTEEEPAKGGRRSYLSCTVT